MGGHKKSLQGRMEEAARQINEGVSGKQTSAPSPTMHAALDN